MRPPLSRTGSSALTGLLDRWPEAARAATRGVVRRGARIILDEPWRLERIVDAGCLGFGEAAQKLVRRRKDVMRELGRRNHTAYDANQMLALRQAYVAVRLSVIRERRGRR